jgi:ketosteroid isomerase-like protein
METTTENSRAVMQRIFDGLAHGDSHAFMDSLAEGFRWTLTGSSSWSGTYTGRKEVSEKLLKPLFANFATRYTNQAVRIIADGEWVAVECRGNVGTKAGRRYDNQYCWVCRVVDGKLQELVEYMDTKLADEVLDH